MSCGFLQLSELRPVLTQLNSTFSEVLELFGNGTYNGTVDPASALRAASMLLCQRDLPQLSDTYERKQNQYIEKLRPDYQGSNDDAGNSSECACAYDNTTSQLICVVNMFSW